MRCVMDHIVLNVTDMEAVLAFYTDVLQLQHERLDEYRQGAVPFPSVRLNADTVIDLFPKSMWQSMVSPGPGRYNLNHLCLALDNSDWHALGERLQGSGVTIAAGPVPRWGAHGTGTSIYFNDPEGNQIEARYYESRLAEKKCLLES